jgi:hypothetical protein
VERRDVSILLPAWEYEDTVERILDASPENAVRGAAAATFREVPLAAGLVLVRGIPLFLLRRRLPSLDRSFYGELLRTPGFVEISREDRAIVAGYVGRPWTPSGGGRELSGAAEFQAFDEPGYAKVVMDLVALPEGTRTRLATTTRIHLTDERSRRWFRLYWLAVHPGSLAVRHSWLAGAERWVARAG